MFVKVYADWKPTEMDDDMYYPREMKRAVGEYRHSIATEAAKSIGHPFRLIRGLINVIPHSPSHSIVDQVHVEGQEGNALLPHDRGRHRDPLPLSP